MKPLLFLFILDFSGSMYQPVDGTVKYKVVQNNVSAMVESVNAQDRSRESGVLVFGLGEDRSCKDIRYNEMSTVQTASEINSYAPGSFSKTPLAESIRRGADIVIQRGVDRLVLFSDGADSCDGDPCQELENANERFKEENVFLEMTFVGIDLKDDAPKFECFKKQYSNININDTKVDNAQDIEAALEQAAEIQKQLDKDKGTVLVRGAPSGSVFKAVSGGRGFSKKQLARAKGDKWKETSAVRLVPGPYQVITNHRGSQAVDVRLASRERKTLYWSDFFAEKKVDLHYFKNGITVLAKPGFSTKISHRSPPEEHYIESPFGKAENFSLPLEFGVWDLEILSPAWLTSNKSAQVSLAVNSEGYKVSLFPIFNLRWEKVPDSSKDWVMEVNSDKKFYIQRGVKMVPVTNDAVIDWLDSVPQ